MQTFPTITAERDIRVSEHVIDKLIHGWLLECTSGTRFAFEGGRTLNLFR